MCTRYWYIFNSGDDLAPGSYFAPTYTQPTCTGGGNSCSIYVCGGGLSPDPDAITSNIATYLAIAKANSYMFYPLVGMPYVASRS